MRTFYFLQLTLMFVGFSSKGQNTISTLSFQANIISNQNDSLDIKAVLTNNSSDTIAYLTMTCGWIVFYEFDTKSLNFRNLRCDTNIPTSVKIAPHSSHQDILQLKVIDKSTFSSVNRFKIGFAFTPVKNENDVDKLWLNYSGPKKLIWCDYLQLK